MSATITLAQLRDLRACPRQVATFKATFGDCVTIVPGLCAQHAETFNWDWAAERLLALPARAALTAALVAAYGADLAAAWAAYDEATAAALAAFASAKASARAAYDASMANAFEAAFLAQVPVGAAGAA